MIEMQVKRLTAENLEAKKNKAGENDMQQYLNLQIQLDKSFKSLLQLCKCDMNETTKKLMHIAQHDAIEETLRREIIDQGKLYVQLFKQITDQQTHFDQLQNKSTNFIY